MLWIKISKKWHFKFEDYKQYFKRIFDGQFLKVLFNCNYHTGIYIYSNTLFPLPTSTFLIPIWKLRKSFCWTTCSRNKNVLLRSGTLFYIREILLDSHCHNLLDFLFDSESTECPQCVQYYVCGCNYHPDNQQCH